MIDELLSYRAADFVPFTAEAYLRLIERVNESAWPLHPLMVAASLALWWLIQRGHGRSAGLLLASMWAWVGYDFLLHQYTSLNWAARNIAFAFSCQAVLLALAGITGAFGNSERRNPPPVDGIGALLYVIGLCYPLLAVLSGSGLTRAEVVGIHPDPTVIMALGLGVIGMRGRLFWISLIVPMGWCLISGVTLWVLGVAWASAVIACGLLALAAGTYRAVSAITPGDRARA